MPIIPLQKVKQKKKSAPSWVGARALTGNGSFIHARRFFFFLRRFGEVPTMDLVGAGVVCS